MFHYIRAVLFPCLNGLVTYFLAVLQPLDESGYVEVRLKAPDLFLQCSIQEKPHNRSCLFKLQSDDAKADLTWSIPAGKRSNAKIVGVVTFVSAFLSVLSIIFSTQVGQHKVLKQC